MPEQTREAARVPAAPAQELPAPAPERQPRGNEAAQAQLAAAEGGGGLENYQAALGDFLGKKLYEAVAPLLTFEKLGPQAKSALVKALGSMSDQIGKLDGVEADPKALENLDAMMEAAASPHIDKLLEKYGPELTGKLSKWVGANPRTVLTVAMLAAAGAVLADMKIPELAKTFKLGKGLSASVEANLGSLRQISLQKLKAKLAYSAGPLKASIEADKDGKVTGGAALTLGSDSRQLALDAKFDGKGLTVAGLKGKTALGDDADLSGSISRSRGEGAISTVQLVRRDGKVTRTDDFRYDSKTGALSIGETALYQDQDYSVRQHMRGSSDGSSSAGFRLDAKQGDASGYLGFESTTSKGAYGLSTEEKLQMGMSFKRSDLTAKLDAQISSAKGGSTISGSVDRKWGQSRAGVKLSAVLDDPKLLEVGAYYGFKDPNEFKSFLLQYKHKGVTSENELSVVVENTLSDIRLRFQQTATWGGKNGGSLDTKFHGAKFMDKDLALIAGVEHRLDFQTGKQSITPQVGVQYKGLPVMLGYDMEKKGVKIGITIPF